MKIGVVGSQGFKDYDRLKRILDLYKSKVSKVVSGGAKGADSLGKRWAEENMVDTIIHPAKWDDLEAEPCVVRTRRDGSEYNVLAGFNRNGDIVNDSDMVMAFWDGESGGTKDTIDKANKARKTVMVIYF